MLFHTNFVADYSQICDKLTLDLTRSGTRYRLAVIVFANAEAEWPKSNIFPHISYWNYRSKEDIDFFFVGYPGESSADEFSVIIDPEEEFHQDVFVETIEEFERRSSWRFSGQTSIIIARAQLLEHKSTKEHRAFLDFSSVIEFDLERALREEVIESVHAFFEVLIQAAKELKEVNPEWKLSDKLGGSILGTALVDAVYSKLPSFVHKASSAIQYFRIKNKGPDK